MKVPLLLTALLLGSASAQVKIGSVVLTKPAPQNTVSTKTSSSPSGLSSSERTAVPAGWQEVTGRISAPSNVNLPGGSTVSVYVEDLNASGAARQFVRIQFKTTRLSTPYQIIFNPVRLKANHQYAVRATVVDASGKLLYASDTSALMPRNSRSVVNVSVRPVR